MALFEALHLHKRFGDQVVLQDVSLGFEEGRLSGIMGPNGAGKTTCFNVLTGLFPPDRGTVRFAGEDITGQAPRQIARKGISRSFQIMNLFNDYSALDNVLVALPAVRRQGFNPWRRRIPCPPAPRARARRRPRRARRCRCAGRATG